MNSERLDEIRKYAASFLKEDRDRLDPHNKFLIGLAQEIIPELLSHIEALQKELDSMQRSYTDVYNRMREEFEINKTLTQERESWGNEFSAIIIMKDRVLELETTIQKQDALNRQFSDMHAEAVNERDTLKAELERVTKEKDEWFENCRLRAEQQSRDHTKRENLRAENKSLADALSGIIEIGKRDMSNPKYDGYFITAREVLNAKADRLRDGV